MASVKYVVSVTTERPSSALTPSGGGGCVTLLDPKTGSILSSLRTSADLSGKVGMGIYSLSTFPSSFSVNINNYSNRPAIAYGGNSTKKGDTYALLISIRNASSPPTLHWKCRLPEVDMSGGLSISPCGYYVAGGGSSGTCYVWATVGGQLLRTFKAHYRSCTCMVWSACGRFLVTGGADGMIHMFSLMDLVDLATRKSKRTVPPLHTFSVHHFPVKCMATLPSGRVASASEDGQLLIMELSSQQVLLNIQFPYGVECLVYNDGRIFAGSTAGTIYCVNLNAYAMHQTEKEGATFVGKRRRLQNADGSAGSTGTIEDFVFGGSSNSGGTGGGSSSSEAVATTNNVPNYQTDWVGHDHPVTAMALLTEDPQQPPLLISGDILGQVRIWDLRSRTCLHILHPWSFGAASTTTNSSKVGDKLAVSTHPITSIQLIPQPTESASSSMFRPVSGKNHPNINISTLVPPLQKFGGMTTVGVDPSSMTVNGESTTSTNLVRVPFLRTNRTNENLYYWEAKTIVRKRRLLHDDPPKAATTDRKAIIMSNNEQIEESGVDEKVQEGRGEDDDDDNSAESQKKIVQDLRDQVLALQKELVEKQSQIERWQNVSNKLLSKVERNG